MERLAYGTEVEFGLQMKKEQPVLNNEQYRTLASMLVAAANSIPLLPSVKDQEGNAWIGSFKFYKDPREHPEVATCETETLDQAVLCEEAAKRLAKAIARYTVLQTEYREKAGQPPDSLDFNHFFLIIPNNTDSRLMHSDRKLNVWGYHENLSHPGPQTERGDILPFLITRQIFAGSGAVLSENAENLIGAWFLLSPRASTLDYGGSGNSKLGLLVGDRTPAFLVKREGGEERVHIAIGETNVSQFQTKLKIGTTKLVHQLFLEGWRPPEFLQYAEDNELAEAGHVIARSAVHKDFGNWIVRLGGKAISAIEIQEIYLNAAQKYFGGSKDKDISWTLTAWSFVLNTLKSDPRRLNIDWVLKLNLYEELSRKGLNRSELLRTDMAYHLIDPDSRDDVFLLAGGRRIYSWQQIQDALLNPPPTTRAQGRFLAIKALNIWQASDSSAKDVPLKIDWGRIEVQGKTTLLMPSPLFNYCSEVLRFEKDLFT